MLHDTTLIQSSAPLRFAWAHVGFTRYGAWKTGQHLYCPGHCAGSRGGPHCVYLKAVAPAAVQYSLYSPRSVASV